MRETDFVSGFAKGLKVIEAFGETQRRLTIAEASKLTGLDRATVRRSLLTLSELGYAIYDGKFFTLTPKILRLGHAYLAATPLPIIIQPHLDQLAERAGQNASASVLDGTEVVYIARASQRRVMSINLTPGSRLPAFCASMGRVLLAALPEGEARSVPPGEGAGICRHRSGTGNRLMLNCRAGRKRSRTDCCRDQYRRTGRLCRRRGHGGALSAAVEGDAESAAAGTALTVTPRASPAPRCARRGASDWSA